MPARAVAATATMNEPSGPRTISPEVNPCRPAGLAMSVPLGVSADSVQYRVGGTKPATWYSQAPISGCPALSRRAVKVSPSPSPSGMTPVRATTARE